MNSVARYFRTNQLAEILDLTPGRLRSWVRAGLLNPERDGRGRLLFGFRDAVEAQTIASLLGAGAHLRDIEQAVGQVRRGAPHPTWPLAEFGFRVEGGRVLVRQGDALAGAGGQLSFDFEGAVDPLDDARVRAQEHFVLGCEAAWEREDLPAAEGHFRRAVELHPEFADAWCDLATVLCRLGERNEGRRLYLRALELEPQHAEALCNLGRMLLQDGTPDLATDYFRRALVIVPEFALAHLHAGIAYEQLGELERAADHLERAIELEPEGNWADEALVALERLRELVEQDSDDDPK